MGTVEGGIWYSNDTYSYNWDRYDDFFDRSLEEDAEVYGYFEEYIDFLEDAEEIINVVREKIKDYEQRKTDTKRGSLEGT